MFISQYVEIIVKLFNETQISQPNGIYNLSESQHLRMLTMISGVFRYYLEYLDNLANPFDSFFQKYRKDFIRQLVVE